MKLILKFISVLFNATINYLCFFISIHYHKYWQRVRLFTLMHSFLNLLHENAIFMHSRPPGRQPLILSFKLKFLVCRHVSMWGFQNRVRLSVRLPVCLSICPYPEKRNHLSFVNVNPTLVIDTSMERSSRVLHHAWEQKKIIFILTLIP